MNRETPSDEIGDWLRASKPQIEPPPGLEARILQSLEAPAKPSIIRFLPWLLLPSAAAIFLLSIQLPQTEPVTRRVDLAPLRGTASAIRPSESELTLQRESLALQHDLQRAGNFLIQCLPTLPAPGE
jgi:hypothetical protein